MSWHSAVLAHCLKSVQPARISTAIVDALLQTLEEWKIYLAGTSSSLGLLWHQAIDVLSLGTWPLSGCFAL